MTARLAVATSLINEPDLLIWDEPTHGLDPEARRSMLELIKTLSREKTLIVSSHNLSDIDEVCNHAAVLSHGQLIYCGSLQDLKGRMRRNHFELDLEGEQKAIAKATRPSARCRSSRWSTSGSAAWSCTCRRKPSAPRRWPTC